MSKKIIYLAFIGLFLGLLITVQIRSMLSLDDLYIRDSNTNVFEEIKILKNKNTDLRKEINTLEDVASQMTDQNLALDIIESDINRYKKLTGDYPIFGPGVVINIDGDIPAPWAVDLINEMFNAGAEAVSINGIRITNKTAGIDALPQGQLLVDGSILTSPYVFNLIGDTDKMLNIFKLSGGILDRIKIAFPEIIINSSGSKVIEMN